MDIVTPEFVARPQVQVKVNYDRVPLVALSDPAAFAHRLVAMNIAARTVIVEFTSLHTGKATQREIHGGATPYAEEFYREVREAKRGERVAEEMFKHAPAPKREKRGGSELLSPIQMKEREAANKLRREEHRRNRGARPKLLQPKQEKKQKDQKNGKSKDKSKKK